MELNQYPDNEDPQHDPTDNLHHLSIDSERTTWSRPNRSYLPPILESGAAPQWSGGAYNGARRRSSSVPNLHSFVVQQQPSISAVSSKRRLQIWRKFRIENYHHRERLYSVLSLLYAIFVMVLGVSLPIAELFGNNTSDVFIGSFEGFYVYLFAVSITFLLFVQLFIIQDVRPPTFVNNLSRRFSGWFASKENKTDGGSHISDSRPSAAAASSGNRNMSFDSHAHSGSFYLRLGAVGN